MPMKKSYAELVLFVMEDFSQGSVYTIGTLIGFPSVIVNINYLLG